jgi:hypothetical protein
MSDRYICFCGVVEVAGQPEDKAVCKECDWEAVGIGAEHLATHHFQRTQHSWELLWEGTPV